MTKRAVGRMRIDISRKSVDKSLHLSTDVMLIDGDMFLILVTEPLNLMLQSHLENEGKLALGMALQSQLAVLHSRGLVPETVYTDLHSTFRLVTRNFPGGAIDVAGASDYIAKADAKIRRIKEMYKNVKLGLLWKLLKVLVKGLIAYVVSRLNIRRTMAQSEIVCPRVLFTGAPVDYRKELQVAHGDYLEAYEGTENTLRARSAVCIAMYPAGNLSGSWILWKIETRTRVRRTNMRMMVTLDLIIQAMNATAAESAIVEEILEQGEVVMQQPAETVATEYVAEAVEAKNPESNQAETPVNSEIAVAENAEEIITEEDIVTAVEEQDAAGAPAVTTRSGRSVHRLVRYMQVTKLSREDWKMKALTIAIEAELRMLFEELKALRCVRRAAIKVGTKMLKSHMFVVEKHLADGSFEKIEAKLVADRRDQDAEMYPDKSSPTVAVHSFFTVLGLAIVIKIDIKDAFVQTPMKGEPVYMRIDPKISQYVVNMFPELGDMLEGDGCLYMLLLKAKPKKVTIVEQSASRRPRVDPSKEPERHLDTKRGAKKKKQNSKKSETA